MIVLGFPSDLNSGQATVGEGYLPDVPYTRMKILSPEYALKFNNSNNYLYKINSNNLHLDFPLTERNLIDAKIEIQNTDPFILQERIKLNNFFEGINSHSLYYGGASDSNAGGISYNTVPLPFDAIAYNMIYNNKSRLDHPNESSWFLCTGSPETKEVLGICTGRFSSGSRGETFDGYYSNLFNIHPKDNDQWIYNLITRNWLVLTHRFDYLNYPSWGDYYGKGIVLISGRSSLYYRNNRPIYYRIEKRNYTFNKNSISWTDPLSGVVGYGGGTYYPLFNTSSTRSLQVLGQDKISGDFANTSFASAGEKFLTISMQGTHVIGQTVPKSVFYYESSINRWVYSGWTTNCWTMDRFRDRIYSGFLITGLSSGEHPWTTEWPYNIGIFHLK